MRIAKIIFISTFAFAIGIAASAAPPEGKGSGKGGGGEEPSLDSFDPEIVYLYRKNGNYELRLTDLDRTSELKMNNLGRVYGVSISSEARKTVAFTTEAGLYLQSWTTGPFRLGEPEFLFSLPTPSSVDFSRNDDKLVFAVPSGSGTGADIVVYNIDTRSTDTVLAGWNVSAMFFSPLDDSIFFEGGMTSEDGIYHFTPGATLPTLRISKANYTGENIDITKPSDIGQPLIVTDNGGEAVFFRLDGAKVYRDFPGYGFNYHFRCTNTELLYFQTTNKTGVSIASFGGKVDNLGLSWTDSRKMDWMERDPCD